MKGSIIYSSLIVIVAVLIIAAAVAEMFSYLQKSQWKTLQEESGLVAAENTRKEAIAYLQALPYEELYKAEGIHDDLRIVKFPDDYKMVNEHCGFVATLISFAGNEVVYEIWSRCKFTDKEQIEKVKVKFNATTQ